MMNAERLEVQDHRTEAVAPAWAVPPVPSRGVREQELEQVKTRLLDHLLRETPQADLWMPLYRAANEAAALAWMTPFPLLMLPVLLEEKADAIRLRTQRQKEIWRHAERPEASNPEIAK